MSELVTNILLVVLVILVLFLICWLLYTKISEHYAKADPVLLRIKHKFIEFFNKDRYWTEPLSMLNNRNIMKEVNFYRGDKSYTINKEKIYICLKNDKGEYYDDNLLIYVTAHELSHALCEEIGHTELFQEIFDALLQELISDGIYNPSVPIDMTYCENGDPEM